MFNQNEYKSVVGLDEIYVALITQDDADGYATETPEWLAPAAELTIKPVTSLETQYADNKPFDVIQSEAESDLEITITNLPAEMHAKLLGSVFDAVSGQVYDHGGVPPYFALGFRSKKKNDKYRFYWFLKTMFSAPEEGAVTQTEKKTPKTAKLGCKAIKPIHKWTLKDGLVDSPKRIWGDEDTTNFDPTGWFLAVRQPSVAAPAALALSVSVPVDDANGVARAANITLTYNNTLQPGAIHHVTLLDNTDAVVAGAITLDDTRKVITINPTATLAALTAHKVVAAVTDIYGQSLTSILTFTTSA
jgi:phi13 family phage major tail protein